MFVEFRSRYDSDRAEWWFLPVAFEQGSWDAMASRGTLYGQESYGLRQGDFNPAVGVPCWECIPCSHSNSGLPEPFDLSCRLFADLLVGTNRSWLQAYSSFCLYADISQGKRQPRCGTFRVSMTSNRSFGMFFHVSVACTGFMGECAERAGKHEV